MLAKVYPVAGKLTRISRRLSRVGRGDRIRERSEGGLSFRAIGFIVLAGVWFRKQFLRRIEFRSLAV